PYPGCELYDVLKSEGKIMTDDWRAFTSYPSYSGNRPVYVPDGRSWQELVQTQKQAMREFYVRRKFIIGELRRFRLSNLHYYYSGLKGLIFPPANKAKDIARK
ncbi:unnamed protein product, partial [marine sediment metagenome]